MNKEKAGSNENDPEYISPEKLKRYISETDAAIEVTLRVAGRGFEDVDSGRFVPFSKEDVMGSLEGVARLITAKRKYYERAGDLEKAEKMAQQVEFINTSLNEDSEGENLSDLFGNIKKSLFLVENTAVETPEEPYEDSAQKADRLWSEYGKIANERLEILATLERDNEIERKAIKAVLDYIDESQRILDLDLESMTTEELVSYINQVREIGKKQNESRDELVGIGGDIKANLDYLKNQEPRAKEIELELRSLGEL
jgi:hypothetical protein